MQNNRIMKVNAIKRILIPTDFSKTGLLAVKHAAFMAKLTKAHLILLHVIEIHESAWDIYNPAVIMRDDTTIQKAAEAQLSKLADSISKEYIVSIETICVSGSVSAEIASAVTENQIDLVIMGTHGAHGFKEYFAGSNAYKTVNICPCPVITVQTNAKKLGFTNIVLPIDDCFESRQKVDFTISLAKKYAGKIHILGLFEEKEDTDLKKFNVKLESVKRAITKAGLSFDAKTIRSEDFGLDTLRYARKVKADLISVLTDHESQYNGRFLGVFAQQVVNHSKIPVLSLHPVELGVYDPVSLAGSNSF
ncbi:MAG: universal stress protein [Bacteroidota bacterium]|nr:universal stress protein [Bacteroidota bacterium]